MSFYTVFEQNEVLLTSTTTTVMASTDLAIVHSAGGNRKFYTTLGAASAQGAFQSVTTATGSGATFPSLLPYGTSIITAAATGAVVFMPAPPAAGIYKSIVMGATSTSTGFQIISSSSASCQIYTTGTSTNTIVPRLQTLLGQNSAYIDLISLSTSQWQVTGMSIGAGCVAFTTTTSS
jgi:hypothetical protein